MKGGIELGWKERLDKLPVTLEGTLRVIDPLKYLSIEECIQEGIGKAWIIATRIWLPLKGVCYLFSLSGPDQAREDLVSLLVNELGKSFDFDTSNPECWIYFWPTDSKEIPETEVHQRLGRGRIKEICRAYALNPKDENLIAQILAIYEIFVGLTDARVKLIAYLTKNLPKPKKDAIFDAVLQINFEFAQKRNSP